MALQYSVAVRNAQLDVVESTIGTAPILRIRTGAAPATCATADSGTVLSELTLPSDWMAAASNGSKALSGTWQDASANATGALAAQQATNEILSLQAQQAMRLQALLVANTRAEALERAREMEVLAQARAQHAHFFAGARSAHPDAPPWP